MQQARAATMPVRAKVVATGHGRRSTYAYTPVQVRQMAEMHEDQAFYILKVPLDI